jgi:hypothetical protein
MRGDTRGAVMLEALIAFVPILLGFTALCQLSDRFVHELIVGRAAAAAARAAIVILPDDGAHYADPHNLTLHRFSGARKTEIERAARAVLAASPSFSNVAVAVSGEFKPGTLATAQVRADYRGLFSARAQQLNASVSLPYQFATYHYASRD